MIRLFSNRLIVVMIVVFMANICIGNARPAWLTHEIEHLVQRVPMTAIAESSSGWGKSVSKIIEHHLLHVADHLQLFAIIFPDSIFLFIPGKVLYDSVSVVIPEVTYGVPFRPPRTDFSLS